MPDQVIRASHAVLLSWITEHLLDTEDKCAKKEGFPSMLRIKTGIFLCSKAANKASQSIRHCQKKLCSESSRSSWFYNFKNLHSDISCLLFSFKTSLHFETKNISLQNLYFLLRKHKNKAGKEFWKSIVCHLVSHHWQLSRASACGRTDQVCPEAAPECCLSSSPGLPQPGQRGL